MAAKRKQSSCPIIFSVHKYAFYLRKELNELGLETFYLRGSTKPQDRLTMANAFNEGEKDVFLISLKAGELD